MARKVSFLACAALVAAVWMGCQTTPPAAPATSAIEVEESGFSPSGGAGHSSIGIAVLWGNVESIASWKVEVVSLGVTVKTWTGDAKNLPANLSWDGMGDGGIMAPEGSYIARLSIDYGRKYRPLTLESTSFVLDITPPSGTIALSPTEFTPSEPGVTEPMTLTIQAVSKTAKMDSWSMDIYDPEGGLVKNFSGRWPTASAEWDGSMVGGGYVSPNTTYSATATVHDEFGNSAQFVADVPVADVPVSTQENVVQPRSAGFSPKSETATKTITLALTFGNRESVMSWKLTVTHEKMGPQMMWTGGSGNLPASVVWDGKAAAGVLAPEGMYTATLSVDYGKAFKPVLVKSDRFVLDITPPAGNVAADPRKLAADGKGGILPVTFTLYGSSEFAALQSWTLNVLDSRGKAAASFNGQWPAEPVVWDGTLAGGGKANPTQAYTYSATIRDEYGNPGVIKGSLATGELPSVQGGVSIVASASGFSPNGDGVVDAMQLALSFGQPDAVSSWKVEVSSADAGVAHTFTGGRGDVPRTLSWDGRTDAGATAPEGTYIAKFSVAYGTVFAPASSESAPFALALTSPTCSIALSSSLFSPLESSDTITLTLDAHSPVAKIDSWTMDIYDPGGNVFRSFAGKWPDNVVVWDGKGANGEFVQSAEDYPVTVKVRDQYGNAGSAKAVVPVDILVEKFGNGYRILASRIFFKSYTADYKDVAPDLARQNMTRLDALALKLGRFPEYRIRIVGHAVMINWNNPAKGKAEQEQVLIPLSKARADAVKAALVERGLDASRFVTEGVGAADQLVPDSNLKDRWQNRRVALFLEKM